MDRKLYNKHLLYISLCCYFVTGSEGQSVTLPVPFCGLTWNCFLFCKLSETFGTALKMFFLYLLYICPLTAVHLTPFNFYQI